MPGCPGAETGVADSCQPWPRGQGELTLERRAYRTCGTGGVWPQLEAALGTQEAG